MIAEKPHSFPFISGGGMMGGLIREKDWSHSVLGTPDVWPQSLRTTLSIILNSKFPMFLFWGPELICFYNDAYRPSLGNNGKHPEILGGRAEEHWEEIWDTIKPLIDLVLTKGEATWSEDQLIPIYRNNMIEDVYWTFSYSPIFDETNKPAGVFVTCNETTEKIKSYKDLEDKKSQLEFTINAAKLATWDLDPVSNKFTANERLKEWFGIDAAGEIELPDALERIDENDRERVIEAITHAMAPGSDGNYEIEYTITSAIDHKKRNVVAKGEVLFDQHHIAYKFSGVLEDVTEERKTIERLEEMKERFETMANNIPNLSWIANSDGWIFWYNSRWYEYTGTTPLQMEGWGWKSVHDPKVLPDVLDKWQASINSGQPFEMVFPLKGGDDIFRPFLTRVVPIRNTGGEIIRWIGTNTDITRQKEAERMKDNFLSMASHELKTPVTTIKAYGQILEGLLENKDPILYEMVKKIGNNTNKLSQIIGDLLDVNRLQSDQLIFKKGVFDFNNLVHEVVDDMQNITSSHKLICELKGDPKVNADREKISQVLINLITNAVKYSPGQNQILIQSTIKNNEVELSVQDFGIGIHSSDQKNVFDQFFRVTGENQSMFPGMGIGLFISSEIIKKQDGKIWVESVPGKGSKFFIQLPVYE